MDSHLLLAARVALARVKVAAEANLGQDLTAAGALTAAGGFGGKAVADRYLAARPMAAVSHDLGSLAHGLGLGARPPVSRMGIAKAFAGRGGGAGKVGLGILAAGIPAWALGRKLDHAHTETAGLRGQVGALQEQLASAPTSGAPAQPGQSAPLPGLPTLPQAAPPQSQGLVSHLASILKNGRNRTMHAGG